jgi:bilirubin oxidase
MMASGGGPLEPGSIPKYVSSLNIPGVMPRQGSVSIGGGDHADFYRIAVAQFKAQILPRGLPRTTVWGYGALSHSDSFGTPAPTIEARAGHPVRVQWINGLVDEKGNYLRHLLPVDPTLHWANPDGPRDGHSMPMTTPGPYRGPVPIVTHVHGAHTTEDSDGYPEAWFLPNARNIPSKTYRVGSFYDRFKHQFKDKWHTEWTPGSATFQYPNDQSATTLWYHDHSLGMTRVNIYAGPAGFYMIRGGKYDLPNGVLPGAVKDSHGRNHNFEIPLMIQDRMFNRDGSLFYPDSREFFDGFSGPFIPDSDIAPIFNPEVFGNTMVVNGATWPVQEVEPRRYRLRLLNACDSRTLILKLVSHPKAKRPASPVEGFWQIGADGGFLTKAAHLPQLLMGPAERADVIVDFSKYREGTEIYLINEGPDEPFGGGEPEDAFESADPNTTGQVMKFRVGRLSCPDKTEHPSKLDFPSHASLGKVARTRRLSLNEEESHVLEGVGPSVANLGILDKDGNSVHLMWDDKVTETPKAGEAEVWEFYNFTEDGHPIHLHQVEFQVLNRQYLAADTEGVSLAPPVLQGEPTGPMPWETGRKDTCIMYPGQVTRLKMKFDIPGRFVWHCHIIEHEDHDMMRPIEVGK